MSTFFSFLNFTVRLSDVSAYGNLLHRCDSGAPYVEIYLRGNDYSIKARLDRDNPEKHFQQFTELVTREIK